MTSLREIELPMPPGSSIHRFLREHLQTHMPRSASAAKVLASGTARLLLIGTGVTSTLPASDPMRSLTTIDPAIAVDSQGTTAYLIDVLRRANPDSIALDLPWNPTSDLASELRAHAQSVGGGAAVRVSASEPTLVRLAVDESRGYPGGVVFALVETGGGESAILIAVPAFDHETFLLVLPDSLPVRSTGAEATG